MRKLMRNLRGTIRPSQNSQVTNEHNGPLAILGTQPYATVRSLL